MNRRRLATVAGCVLFAVGFGFCLGTAMREADRVRAAVEGAAWGWIAVGLALAGAAMLVVAVGWSRCLGALGAPRAPAAVVAWFFVGEVGKYIPGAVWPILGRGELAHRDGVARSSAYRSVALSLAALYGAAVLPVAVVAAHPRIQAVVVRAAARFTGGRLRLAPRPWAELVRLLLAYFPAWLLVGAVTWSIGTGFGDGGGWQAPAAAVLAWVCGFLAVPVPAGAGVREAVFVATSGLDPGLALTVAVTARLAFVTVDLLGAAVAAPSGLVSRARVVGER